MVLTKEAAPFAAVGLLNVSDVTDEENVCNEPQEGHRRRLPGMGMILSSLALGGAACALAVSLPSSPTTKTGSLLDATQLDEVACGAVGDACTDSKCCIDGGSKGLQCYKKNDDYAECYEFEACEEGVHEGETHGEWDASGTFVKDSWSCESAGKKSEPGCESFDKAKCPSDRCQLSSDGKCRTSCSILPSEDSCWGAGYCMWDGGACEKACWEFDETKCKTNDACTWFLGANNSCKVACHVHMDEGSCPHENRCIWQDMKCQSDPCSAQWEDCRETKCCSTARGAEGMACFSKDDTYASCLDVVDPKYQKKWSGKQIGNRTKFSANCNWAGDSCSETKACCNLGFNCAVKDDTFIGCVQVEKVSSWETGQVAMPADWAGDVVGGWHGQYAVDPAPEGVDPAGATLYCVMGILPDSGEVALKDVAKSNNGSVFACEFHSVFDSWQTGSSGWDTGEATVINTDVFVNIFKQVKAAGLYLKADWTVKVDADCVFLPQRLREHIWGLRPPAGQAIYLKNNNLDAGMGNDGFLGAIEVFSKRAMQIYLDNDDDCAKNLGSNSGEDGFFKGCMTALGVGYMMDGQMFKPFNDPVVCTDASHAAYHPFKFPTHWQRCWDIATGKMCQGVTYDCGDPLDPPIDPTR